MTTEMEEFDREVPATKTKRSAPLVRPYFRIQKTSWFSAAHHLSGLPKGHKCARPHGHNYKAVVTLKAYSLDTEVGHVMDFGTIKAVTEQLDHQDLNEVMEGINPTAENIAKFVFETLSALLAQSGDIGEVIIESVRIHETKSCWGEYGVEFVS